MFMSLLLKIPEFDSVGLPTGRRLPPFLKVEGGNSSFFNFDSLLTVQRLCLVGSTFMFAFDPENLWNNVGLFFLKMG